MTNCFRRPWINNVSGSTESPSVYLEVLSDRATWPRDLDLTGNEQPRDGARIISFAGWRAHRVGDMLLVRVMTRRRIACRRNGTKPFNTLYNRLYPCVLLFFSKVLRI